MTSVASILMALGLLFVYVNWKKKSPNFKLAALLGWLMVVISSSLFIYLHGKEFGIVIALGTLSLMAWCFVVFNIKRSSNAKKLRIHNSNDSVSSKLQLIGMFIVAGPINIVACSLFSMAWVLVLPTDRVDQMSLAALSFPTLFGLVCCLVYMYQKPLRDMIVLCSISIISALWIFL